MKILLVVVSFCAVAVLGYIWLNSKIIIRLENKLTNIIQFEDNEKEKSKLSLEKVVSEALGGTDGTYSVVVKNLTGKEEFSQAPDHVYESGSLYKLWVMAAVFEKIKQDSLAEDDILSRDVAKLNRDFQLDADSAELSIGR